MKVLLGIATYKRPELLTHCLRSLVAMDHGEHDVQILVVDNDKVPSAKPTCDQFDNILYNHEVKPGISEARNCVLDYSASKDFDLIGFLDDDQTVYVDWLAEMIKALKSFDADVVKGDNYIRVENKSPWFDFKPQNKKTGDVLKYTSTNGVLFKNWIAEILRFDRELGLTGGEDTDFFIRAYKLGAKQIAVQSAKTIETWDDERTGLFMLAKKTFINDSNKVTVMLKNDKVPVVFLTYFFKGLQRLILGLIYLFGFSSFAIVIMYSGHKFSFIFKGIRKIASGLGYLFGLTRKRHTYYRSKD